MIVITSPVPRALVIRYMLASRANFGNYVKRLQRKVKIITLLKGKISGLEYSKSMKS